jgi:ATPase components of ABC transporters with duplicated ATPase domains
MSVININNLTFAYEGSYDNVFENVNLQIDSSWRLGLVGRNGRGKTTLLRLLMGEYEYSGSIKTSLDFMYFPFEVSDKTKPTLDIVCNTAPDAQEWEAERELSLLDMDAEVLNQPFDTLSKGEQTKVLLAALFLGGNSFLLIDEPTNHLDMQARQAVGKYLQGKDSFILVSHDRSLLDRCIDHVMSINKTGIELQKGSFSSWFANKEKQDAYELGENDKLSREILRLKDAAMRTAGWSDKLEKTKLGTRNSGLRPDRGFIGHKSAKMMQKSKNAQRRRQEAVDHKMQLLKDIESSESLKLCPLIYRSKRLAAMDKVSVYYDSRQVCANVSFEICAGDRIALTGKNGSGKSSILKLLLGEDICHTGEITVPRDLAVSYVSQDTSRLSGSLTDFAQQHSIDRSLFMAILRKLDFERIQFEKDIQSFSAGQKKKVLIAKSLCEKAHLLIWDEPLNYIDVISRMQIENLILDYKPTIIFVEHDAVFTDKTATSSVVLTAKTHSSGSS